ncbi:ParB N-terminal domain-containing protein [Micromonospora sp. NPDC049903]|uniref:ParB N-terminal domain-containing protein n=1 Tax=Micromonospora sp. NPDC049903 TaxID=3364276 RepID=UPI0037A97CA1
MAVEVRMRERIQVAQSREVTFVDVCSVVVGSSPRSTVAGTGRIQQLADSVEVIPPILVQRSTMRVVDGAQRLAAARLRGDRQIAVTFFDGSDDDAFVAAVHVNVRHGMPLTGPERAAAARRILSSHPERSDRWIASVCGVAPRTVATLRRCSPDDRAHPNIRVGRDGRQRPLSAADGRRRAAELMRRRPEASLREVAREAGISVGTAFDVRRQLATVATVAWEGTAGAPSGPDAADPLGPVLRAGLERLANDPSLRYTERGRALLGLVSATLVLVEQSDAVADATPGHCRDVLRNVGEACARAWHEFTDRLGDTDLTERAA